MSPLRPACEPVAHLPPLAQPARGSTRFRHFVTAITGGGWVLCEVNEVSHGTKGSPMRKLGIIGLAIVVATAFGVWSADTVANSKVAKAEVAVVFSAPPIRGF